MHRKKILLLSLVFFIAALYISIEKVYSDEEITIDAIVPPQNDDYQLTFNSETNSTYTRQQQTLNYHIQYGAKQSAGYDVSNKITVRYNADFPNGSPILGYIHGSATNAYGNIPPVIDLDRRTITWNISSLPPGTIDQDLYFRLIVSSNYTGPTVVNFTTYADMTNQYFTMPTQKIYNTFRYEPDNSTPPSSTTSVTQSAEKHPTTPESFQPAALRIQNLAFREISRSETTIEVTTDNPSQIALNYGLEPNKLTKKKDSNTFSRNHLIELSELLPGTRYYFQVVATDSNGQKLYSDIYVFTTALDSEFELTGNGGVAIGSGNILVPVVTEENGSTFPLVVITTDTDYRLTYTLPRNLTLNSLNALIQNNTADLEVPTIIPMHELEPRIYATQLRTAKSGRYAILARMRDINGNLKEQNIAKIKVVRPLTVYKSKDNTPLSDARVYIYYFDFQSNQFEPLDPKRFGDVKNPQFTDKNGELNILLPAGRYRAVTSAFGHSEETVEFTLGDKTGEEFPIIVLDENYSNLSYMGRHAKNWLVDSFNNLTQGIRNYSESARSFNIVAALTVASFTIITLLLFTIRSRLHPKFIPTFLLFHVHRLFRKHRQKYIYGTVIGDGNKPAIKAQIEVIDAKTGNILTHMQTGKTGRFYLNNKNHLPVKLRIEKEGYLPSVISQDEIETKDNLRIKLVIGANHPHLPSSSLFRITEHLIGNVYESFLLASLVSQIMFFSIFGFSKTLPFFILSLINILLWAFYTKEHQENKSI